MGDVMTRVEKKMTLTDVLAANQSHEASAMAQCDGLIYFDLPSTETTLTDLMIFIFFSASLKYRFNQFIF